MKSPWTESELKLLGTRPDAEVGQLVGRPGKSVWAKRKALGIPGPPPLVRAWTEEEDKLVLTMAPAAVASATGRTLAGVWIRRRKLLKKLHPESVPKLLTLEEARLRIEVPRYDSKEQEEKVRFVAGPYSPPFVGIGGWLKCEVRGDFQVGGYSNALIPWPVAAGHARQLILCGDLVLALRTESRLAVGFHFGISKGWVSEYRRMLGIERMTPGSTRLFWRNVDLARTDEARAKLSKRHEGRGDMMTPEQREKLREIQKRPKSEAWKRRMAERRRRRYAATGPAAKWTAEETKMIGARPDREVAKLLDRSLMAIKAKKFQLRRKAMLSAVQSVSDDPSA